MDFINDSICLASLISPIFCMGASVEDICVISLPIFTATFLEILWPCENLSLQPSL